ncbi:MAG: YicC/YloC family endoribonuclease [Sneathiellaceae bacterium]
MALSSMTGFARQQGGNGQQSWTWEIRSVNGRGLDLRLRLAPGAEGVEAPARAMLSKRLRRGSVSCNLQLATTAQALSYRINQPLLEELAALASGAAATIEAAPPRLDGLLALRGVLEAVEPDAVQDVAALEQALLADLELAVDGLERSRQAEGARLAEVLVDLVGRIEDLVAAAQRAAALRQDRQRDRLREQVAALLDAGAPLPEERLAQELAMLAVKADIAEELDRLTAHVAQARGHLAADAAVGRELDFLAQEFNREANTICSKANDLDLTRIGLDLKLAIDRLREQVQNVE